MTETLIVPASGKTKANPPRGTLEVFGHSGARGNASGRRQGVDTFSRLAQRLGAHLVDKSVGGSVLVRNESATQAGGQIHAIMNLNRRANLAPPYTPDGDIIALWYGLNDLAMLGPGATNLIPFLQALRAVIAHARLAARFEDSSTLITYGGTWTQGFIGGLSSGSSYKSSATSGGTATYPVPADFPGGEVDLFFVVGANFTGTISVTVDGVTAPGSPFVWGTDDIPQDYNTGANGQFGQHVIRIKDLAPGAHTIVATQTALGASGGPLFDGYGIKASTPPIVVVPLSWRALNYSLWSTWAYSGIGNADVLDLNTRVQTVIDEFDDDVIGIDVESLINLNSNYFLSDGVHLNDVGHAKVADLIYDVLQEHFLSESPDTYDLRIRSGEDFLDPLDLGIVTTVDPRHCVGAGTFTANSTYYTRTIGAGPILGIQFIVGTSAGNISVGLYGGDRWSHRKKMKPVNARWRSNAMACPASGIATIVGSGEQRIESVQMGDFMALSTDSATATFERAGLSTLVSGHLDGISWREAVHPCPATAGTLVSNSPVLTPFLFGSLQ